MFDREGFIDYVGAKSGNSNGYEAAFFGGNPMRGSAIQKSHLWRESGLRWELFRKADPRGGHLCPGIKRCWLSSD